MVKKDLELTLNSDFLTKKQAVKIVLSSLHEKLNSMYNLVTEFVEKSDYVNARIAIDSMYKKKYEEWKKFERLNASINAPSLEIITEVYSERLEEMAELSNRMGIWIKYFEEYEKEEYEDDEDEDDESEEGEFGNQPY